MSDQIDSPDPEDNRSSAGRREYDDANAALNRHIQANDKRLRRFFKGALVAFGIIGVACTLALAGFGIVLAAQQRTADQLRELVDQNRKFAADIQKQRANSIRETCAAQNARNEGAIEALKKGSDEDQANAPNEAARREIRRRRDVTIALINALAPYQDCEERVRKAVKDG